MAHPQVLINDAELGQGLPDLQHLSAQQSGRALAIAAAAGEVQHAIAAHPLAGELNVL